MNTITQLQQAAEQATIECSINQLNTHTPASDCHQKAAAAWAAVVEAADVIKAETGFAHGAEKARRMVKKHQRLA